MAKHRTTTETLREFIRILTQLFITATNDARIEKTWKEAEKQLTCDCDIDLTLVFPLTLKRREYLSEISQPGFHKLCDKVEELMRIHPQFQKEAVWLAETVKDSFPNFRWGIIAIPVTQPDVHKTTTGTAGRGFTANDRRVLKQLRISMDELTSAPRPNNRQT